MYELVPQRIEKITTAEAAALLHMQKGYAGYSLINDDTEEGGSIGHAVFCQNCGTEVATVYVNFVPPEAPAPGSRLAVLMDLAKYATEAKAAQERKRATRAARPVAKVQ